MSCLFFLFLPSELILLLPEIRVVVVSLSFSMLVWLLTN